MIGAAAAARRTAERIASALVVVVVAATFVFLVFQQLADPAVVELGRFADPEALARRRVELGLDRPLLVRLAHHLGAAIGFDFGRSTHFGRPVIDVVLERLGPTLGYVVPGAAVATALAVLGGSAAAEHPRSIHARVTSGLATALIASSSVVLVVMAHEILAHRLGLGEIVGWPLVGSGEGPGRYLILPTLVFAVAQIGPDLRHHQSVFAERWRAPWLDGLEARGIGRRRLRARVLRAALPAVLARLGHRLPHWLLGSVLIEELFNVPGLGELVLTALRASDLALMQGLALLLAWVTIVLQAAFDAAAAVIDPRTRAR